LHDLSCEPTMGPNRNPGAFELGLKMGGKREDRKTLPSLHGQSKNSRGPKKKGKAVGDAPKYGQREKRVGEHPIGEVGKKWEATKKPNAP